MAIRMTEEEYKAFAGSGSETPPRRKYGNVKATLDGINFDSEHERDRYAELKMLEKAGEIRELKLQPVFELIPAIREHGKTVQRAVTYKADFSYHRVDGEYVVEDAKGLRTDVYKLKKKMFRYKYGIEIQEV